MIVNICLFTSPTLIVDEKKIEITSTKAWAILAYMLLENKSQSREFIATMIWGELPQERAFANLRQLIYKLNGYFPKHFLVSTRTSISISEDIELWIDVNQFRQLLEQNSNSIDHLIEACNLYRGELLSGINLMNSPEFDFWLQLQRRELLKLAKSGYSQIITYYIEREQIDVAIKYANQLVNLDPIDETNHRLLMQLYIDSGEEISAINQYHICTEILDMQLGVGPHTETRHLYESIIHQDFRPITKAEKYFEPITLYPPRPALTVGRDTDLQKLFELLSEKSSSEIYRDIVIQGWPGVGKSTMVSLLAHDPRINQQFPDGVLWTALGESADAKSNLSKWTQRLGMENIQVESSLEQLSEWIRNSLRNRQILLIVDDVWKSEIAQWFRLGGENCAVVFTTRFNDVARQIAYKAEDIYKLEILDNESALYLLEQLAPDVVAIYPEESLELIKDLEGLPLALQVAGRLLQSEIEMGWGIQDLLYELQEGTALLKADAPSDRFDSMHGTIPSVSTLLTQSTNRLDEIHRIRFASLGFFAPKPATFAIDALAAMWEVDDPKDSIREFVNRGLMEPASNRRFQVHSLLIAHAKSLFKLSNR